MIQAFLGIEGARTGGGDYVDVNDLDLGPGGLRVGAVGG
jgi:hypothetical protein